MKKNFIFSVIFFCWVFSFSSFAQWKKIIMLTGTQTFEQISVPNDKTIWGLTNDRNLYITKNGGNKWKHYAANGIATNVSIEWIFAFDSLTALLGSSTIFTGSGPGILYRTTDGGHNWIQVFSHPGNCDFKIGMADKNNGLLAINKSNFTGRTKQELLATADGGLTWNKKLITDPTSFYVINDLFVKGQEAWLQAQDTMYYSANLGVSWKAEKVASNIGFNHMQFENKNYGIGNNGALTELFIKRPPKKKWQDIGDPTGVGGAVSGLVLNGNECWLSEALDAIQNYYSNDSCKTFTPVIVDSQSAFFILQKAWQGNTIWGSTKVKLYVYTPQITNISLKENYVSLSEENMGKNLSH